MTTPLLLPPVYRLLTVPASTDAFLEAERVAAEGAEVGTLLWSRRPDRLDCAVVLGPDVPLAQSLLVVYVAMLGLGDGLGSLAPPVTAVTFGWPDRIEVNGGVVGGVRLRVGAIPSVEAPPLWMTVGATVAIGAAGDGVEPGHDPSRTTLWDEGCGDIDAAELLESFGRHFLAWMDRWQDDGFGPVREAWIGRASERGGPVEVALTSGMRLAGQFAGIDDAGALLLMDGERTLAAGLAQALSAPSWRR